MISPGLLPHTVTILSAIAVDDGVLAKRRQVTADSPRTHTRGFVQMGSSGENTDNRDQQSEYGILYLDPTITVTADDRIQWQPPGRDTMTFEVDGEPQIFDQLYGPTGTATPHHQRVTIKRIRG